MQKNGPKYILLYKIFDFYVISFSDNIISSKAYERVMKHTPYYHNFLFNYIYTNIIVQLRVDIDWH